MRTDPFALYELAGKGVQIWGSFSLLSLIWALIQNIIHYPAYIFLIRWDLLDGMSARDVQKLLEAHGVKTWGLLLYFNSMMISVPQKQARWASYLLERHHIPVENPIIEGGIKSNIRVKDLQHAPVSSPSQRGVWLRRMLSVADFLDRWVLPGGQGVRGRGGRTGNVPMPRFSNRPSPRDR
ncbi:MAG: hypothetical protein GXO55_11070 [Chloroflexi bacterium]|nr:hypothetical protein [Chloroflexota bacterium]